MRHPARICGRSRTVAFFVATKARLRFDSSQVSTWEMPVQGSCNRVNTLRKIVPATIFVGP
jgi:hypothetical protein